jgi:hypothetical protein
VTPSTGLRMVLLMATLLVALSFCYNFGQRVFIHGF